MTGRPAYDADLFDDTALADPAPHWRALRDLGPAVALPRHGLIAVARHAEVRAVLEDPATFVSGKGVAANDRINAISSGNLLASDPPLHTTLRKIVGAPLSPRALAAIRPEIEAEADGLIDRLLTRERFDAMTDLAQHLPLTIVARQVGLPAPERARMLDWAAATFDALGPDNARMQAAWPRIQDLRAYTHAPETRAGLRPGSWAAQLFDAAEAGRLDPAVPPTLMRDYLGPSLDTTIFATGHLIHRLATTPEAWARLRRTPALIPAAINEAVRLDSPIRCFTRVAARPARIGGLPVEEGARLLVLYGSANRDERAWHDPDRYALSRDLSAQLGFGHGIHRCAGAQLARLEMRALLQAMIPRVTRIETGPPVPVLNNLLNGFASLPARFHPA